MSMTDDVQPMLSHHLLETWSDGYAAWARLMDEAAHSVWLVDHDMTGFHPDQGDHPQILHRCLRRLNADRLRILVCDIQPLLTRMPRTRQLLIDYGHVASVRVAALQHADSMTRGLIICDDRHALVRPSHEHPKAHLYADDPSAVARNVPHLETIWNAASNASIGAVLGL